MKVRKVFVSYLPRCTCFKAVDGGRCFRYNRIAVVILGDADIGKIVSLKNVELDVVDSMSSNIDVDAGKIAFTQMLS